MRTDSRSSDRRRRAGVVALVLLGGVAAGACGGDAFGPVFARPGSLAVGLFHTCWSDPGGNAWCWGNNSAGQIGDGSGGKAANPKSVESDVPIAQLAAGLQHSCALDDEGGARCWGDNSAGQIGDGSVTLRLHPQRVDTDLSFAVIRAGGFHTCALTTDGVPYCWGANDDGQLGLLHPSQFCSTRPCADRPTRVEGGVVLRSIEAGFTHTCGLTADGVAYCWGANGNGQLGNGYFTSVSRPVLVTGGIRFRSLTVGERHTCGLTADDEVYCWGRNVDQQLGVELPVNECSGFFPFPCSPRPVKLVTSLAFRSITAGADHTCGLTWEGQAFCWGRNESAQLGIGGVTASQGTPQPVSGGHRFAVVGAGNSHTCGVSTDRILFCWGDNLFWQLGIGPQGIYSPAPILVAFPEVVP